MGKRRSDADNRRFFDEFQSVRVSRFRAMGVIDPAKRQAVIPFPDGTTKLIGTGHVRFPNGGGWSYFVCPKCAKLAVTLYLIDDAPRCTQCCDAMNIKYAAAYGFGRDSRRKAQDKRLDELIAKVESSERLKLKPAPASWGGRAQVVYRSRKLREQMRRRMITLRLHQLANQQASDRAGDSDVLKTFRPLADTGIDLTPIWRANTQETLQQALDNAQCTILAALDSDDPQQRLNAARLLLRTKQARDRGL
jgi:hypothetical protein